MKTRIVCLVLGMVLAVSLVGYRAAPSARAGDPGNSFKDEWGAYPVDFVDLTDLLEKEGLGNSMLDFSESEEACPDSYEVGEQPDTPDIVYKTFHRQASGSPAIPLFIDEWDPNVPPETPAPAMI